MSDITGGEWPAFANAIEHEVNDMVNKNNAITPLSLAMSEEIRRTMPDRILPTRLALRRKPVGPEGNVDEELRIGKDHKAKCRWICLLYTSPSPRDRTRSRMPSSA